MDFQNYYVKTLGSNPDFSGGELSQEIAQVAFNTSSLLAEMGQHFTDNPNYRNVFVTHPSIEDIVEGGSIPDSTVQTYSTTQADYNKVSTNIEISNEAIMFSNFDLRANTAELVGVVTANKVAQVVLSDLEARQTETPDLATGEDVKTVLSGIDGAWSGDAVGYWALFRDTIKEVSDVYDGNSKFYMNKDNFLSFATVTTVEGEQIWLIQNGMVLGRYPIVIVDQLSDDTIYFGDMQAAFDIVSQSGNQIVDDVTKPNSVRITNTGRFGVMAKDSRALVCLKQGVTLP